MDKNNELQRKQEDAAFAHGLWYVGGAVVIEFILMLLKKYYFIGGHDAVTARIAYQIELALPYALGVMIAVFVIAAVKGFLSFKKSGTICPVVEGALVASGVLTLSLSMGMMFGLDGCTMMMLFVPALGALCFSFFLYQHDFFYSAALAGGAALVLWMIWHSRQIQPAVLMISVLKLVVIPVLMIAMAVLLKKSGGKLTILGHEVTFLPRDAVYPAIYASAVIAAVAVIAAYVMGGMIPVYLIYVMGAWIFALLVYYTVRML